MKHITMHYSEAQPLSSLEKRILKELDDQSIKPDDCIWGTSICSDEINNNLLGLSKHFKAPGPFFFGGISGIPFTGKTGFKAFASHIPDDGGAVIIYGPHVGLNKEGVIGEVHREGQENPTSCCGSLIAGLNNVKEGNVLTIAHDDYQQGQVNKLLIEHYEDLKKSDHPVKTTTEIAYNQIKKEITDIISACAENLGGSPVLTIGGIVINTDWDQEDYFEIRDISWFNK